jgi:putative DNA primase/helicase
MKAHPSRRSIGSQPPPSWWLHFLDKPSPNEPEAVDVLQEWFGYVISGRLDLHKILLMVGPTGL